MSTVGRRCWCNTFYPNRTRITGKLDGYVFVYGRSFYSSKRANHLNWARGIASHVNPFAFQRFQTSMRHGNFWHSPCSYLYRYLNNKCLSAEASLLFHSSLLPLPSLPSLPTEINTPHKRTGLSSMTDCRPSRITIENSSCLKNANKC